MPDSTNGWSEYRRLVLHELEKHSSWMGEMDDKIDRLRTDISTLKVKSGLWGAAAGIVPAAVAIVWMLVR